MIKNLWKAKIDGYQERIDEMEEGDLNPYEPLIKQGIIKDGWIWGYLAGNYILGECVESCDEYINFEYWYSIIPETAVQYTGFDDKNGTHIFVGDFIRISNEYNVYYVQVELYKGEYIIRLPFGRRLWLKYITSDTSQEVEVVGSDGGKK